MAQTVDELCNLIRDDIDEDNVVDVTPADILQKLNRAQRKGVIKIIRNYDSLFLTSRDVTTTATSDYAWAPNVYAGKIKKLELVTNGRASEIRRLHYRQSTPYVSDQTTTRPSRYELVGKKWRLYGTPAAGLTIREWYVRTPERLVLQQGRVLASGTDAATTPQQYVTVDSLGSGLTTDTALLNCYVNIIDYQTGLVKGTLQVASLDTVNSRVLFKAAGLSRSTVLGKTVDVALPTDIAVDDYICTVHGTCVPEIPEAYHDYLTQHAVVAIKRGLGEPTKEDYAALKEEEDDIEQIYQGVETRVRIAQRNPLFQRGR